MHLLVIAHKKSSMHFHHIAHKKSSMHGHQSFKTTARYLPFSAARFCSTKHGQPLQNEQKRSSAVA